MGKGFDISNVQKLIDEKKEQQFKTAEALGEQTGIPVVAKDNFLNGLVEAVQKGQHNQSSIALKELDVKASKEDQIKGHKVIKSTSVGTNVLEHVSAPKPIQQQNQQNFQQPPEQSQELQEGGNERGLYDEMMKKTNEYQNKYGNSMNVVNEQQIAGNHQPQQQTQGGGMINEQLIVERVDAKINGYLENLNIGKLLEDALKNAILEIYAVDRVKKVMTENVDIVKKQVVDTIRDLQSRNKK